VKLEHSCDAVSQDARADQIMAQVATYSRDEAIYPITPERRDIDVTVISIAASSARALDY